ncbi:MAG: class I SAM-dependent methyltransferase, partial [Lachnospiraceae bacterium]|nr:class I SAM-dependent methyltransferase [Lachnospiraceae bacterium]
SRRLQAVAALAEPGKTVADIGCDHGYVGIWLIQQKIFPRVIAMDVRPGPLETAKKNVALYRMEDAIELRLSDGLRMLEIGEADSMICAGMGGALICHILENESDKAKAMKQIILQPQSELFLVRRFLRQHGYAIIKEDMVKEDGKYYPMLRAVWQEETMKLAEDRQDIYDAYGRLLLEGRHPVLYEWLLHEQTVICDILSGLQKAMGEERDTAAGERQKLRLSELKEKQRRIEAALSYYA